MVAKSRLRLSLVNAGWLSSLGGNPQKNRILAQDYVEAKYIYKKKKVIGLYIAKVGKEVRHFYVYSLYHKQSQKISEKLAIFYVKVEITKLISDSPGMRTHHLLNSSNWWPIK